MYLFALTGHAALMAALATAGLAHADDCVDPRQNNPAFASPYVAAAKPCPAIREVPPGAKAKLPRPEARRVARTAVASVSAGDRTTVTAVPGGGTLIKSGDTTICVRGSITVDVATGRGRLRSPVGADAREQSCD